jgi:hypothetical protein
MPGNILKIKIIKVCHFDRASAGNSVWAKEKSSAEYQASIAYRLRFLLVPRSK